MSNKQKKERKEAYKKEALEAISSNNIAYIAELVCLMTISTSTFYKYKLHKNNKILDAINANKVARKAKMRDRWEKFDQAPALQIAAYKLLATDDELDRLNNNRRAEEGEKMTPVTIVYDKESTEYLKNLKDKED